MLSFKLHNNEFSFLKVRNFRRQFMISSILPKNERKNEKNWANSIMIPQVQFFLFAIWENWRHHNLLSRFTDLYLAFNLFAIATMQWFKYCAQKFFLESSTGSFFQLVENTGCSFSEALIYLLHHLTQITNTSCIL